MTHPFSDRIPSPSGPAADIAPVTPDDGSDLPTFAVALYVETGGDIAIITADGASRTVAVADFAILPVMVRRVLASGTTASGIHAFTVT